MQLNKTIEAGFCTSIESSGSVNNPEQGKYSERYVQYDSIYETQISHNICVLMCIFQRQGIRKPLTNQQGVGGDTFGAKGQRELKTFM